jgi:hypothetical protein
MLPCPTGNYCPKGTYIPIPAPRGYFAPGEGNAQAALCLPGSYTHYEGFQGRAVQVEPMGPVLKPPGSQRLMM